MSFGTEAGFVVTLGEALGEFLGDTLAMGLAEVRAFGGGWLHEINARVVITRAIAARIVSPAVTRRLPPGYESLRGRPGTGPRRRPPRIRV